VKAVKELREHKAFILTCSVLCAASLVVLLLCLAILTPAFGMWFYEYEYEKNDTYSVVRMEREDLLDVTRHMIGYMRDRNDSLQIYTTVNGHERAFFSQLEIEHMYDVKVLMTVTRGAWKWALLTLAASIAALYPFGKRKITLLLKTVSAVSGGIIALLAVIAVIGAVNFDFAFTWFHLIFFNNDKWILDARVDLLINIVPIEFFIDAAILLGAIFAAGLVLLAAVPSAALYKLKKRWSF
jgi:integral membrane protein (TIGR01906 family)